MNIKRAAGIIFVLFIAVHTSSVIGSKLLGINLETADPTIMPPAMWYIALISVSIVGVLGAMWFFRSHKTVPNTKNGFLFGLAASIFGFIGDIILLAPVDVQFSSVGLHLRTNKLKSAETWNDNCSCS